MWVWSMDQEDPWRRAWQPTPVFLPGESHGQRSLVSYSMWGCKESDMTEASIQGSVGLPGTKVCDPHFFDYRESSSFSLHDLSWVPMGILKQLLIREGRGKETREKPTVKSSLGARSSSPSMDTHSNFELFCRHWNPLQMGEVKD